MAAGVLSATAPDPSVEEDPLDEEVLPDSAGPVVPLELEQAAIVPTEAVSIAITYVCFTNRPSLGRQLR